MASELSFLIFSVRIEKSSFIDLAFYVAHKDYYLWMASSAMEEQKKEESVLRSSKIQSPAVCLCRDIRGTSLKAAYKVHIHFRDYSLAGDDVNIRKLLSHFFHQSHRILAAPLRRSRRWRKEYCKKEAFALIDFR